MQTKGIPGVHVDAVRNRLAIFIPLQPLLKLNTERREIAPTS